MRQALFIILAFCFNTGFSSAQELIPRPELMVQPSDSGVVEHLNAQIPNDLMVIDTLGQSVSLRQLIDKPTALLWVYYRCPGICSPLMSSVADNIGKIDLKAGIDYQIITISFDPREDSELAILKRNNYLKLINKPVVPQTWKFYTADSINIKKGTEVTGFSYSQIGNDFSHPAVVIVINADGNIVRYLHGINTSSFALKMALLEASKRSDNNLYNNILRLIYNFNPLRQQYILNVWLFVAIAVLFTGGILTIGAGIRRRQKQGK